MLTDFFRAVAGSFHQFRWGDITDIILVAFLIYQGIMLSRRTRAVQVFKGLGAVLVAYLLAQIFQLSALKWLLEKALASGAIVLVVIFQPELRRMLERLGRGHFLFGKKKWSEEASAYRDMANVLGEAMTNLAARYVGALIVIENRTGLGDIMATGTPINADVSVNLIEQIFEPNTPLHDGAVVIKELKIASAGCFLPLSETTSIASTLGTRHRAALGVSEISDALAFVVSEETGTISVAQEGNLRRGLRKEDVVDLILHTAESAYGIVLTEEEAEKQEETQA